MPPIWSFHLKHSFLPGGCNGRFSGNFLREQECACAVQSLLRVSGFVAVEIELVTIVSSVNITMITEFLLLVTFFEFLTKVTPKSPI